MVTLQVEPLLTSDTLVADSAGALKTGDPRLQATCDAATKAVRRFCGWHVAPIAVETVTLDGGGGTVLQLPSQHVVNVRELEILGVEVPVSDYAWSPVGLIEVHKPGLVFPKRYGSVIVTFEHGYEEAPDLVAVASQVARFALASPMGRTREQAGQIAVSWGAASGFAWSDGALEMMRPYRLQNMP